MEPKRHASNNTLCGPPPNWDDRGGRLPIPALHVTRGKVEGVDVFVSWWQPSQDELACMLRGGVVQLSCLGGQPACNVSAVDAQQGVSILLPN